jgi:hypothetical protein
MYGRMNDSSISGHSSDSRGDDGREATRLFECPRASARASPLVHRPWPPDAGGRYFDREAVQRLGANIHELGSNALLVP